MTWSKSYSYAKLENSSEEYCGRLSFMMVSGIPCLENIFLSAAMIFAEVVLVSLMISG